MAPEAGTDGRGGRGEGAHARGEGRSPVERRLTNFLADAAAAAATTCCNLCDVCSDYDAADSPRDRVVQVPF